MEGEPIPVALTGVPETMLWPLWNRASEQRRADRLIDDPLAAVLAARLDCDFKDLFGKPSVLHVIRARVGDDLVRAYLAAHPGGTVVALGEGLETQFWRVGSMTCRWISVDMPEAISLRRTPLPDSPRMVALECSALDPAWMDAVPSAPPPFISAAGLLMYFDEQAVFNLLTAIARRFPGAQLFFDTIPPGFSRRTLKGHKVTPRYTAPPMPWGIAVSRMPTFVARAGGWQSVFAKTYAEPFSHRTPILALLSRVAAIRDSLAPALIHALNNASISQ